MIKVMIALQGRLYSEGMRSLLKSSSGGIEVAALADDEDDHYRRAQTLRPHVIITDMKTLACAFPEGAPHGARIIAIGSEGEELADLILNGTISGALHDSSGPLTLETAIKAVSMGVVWMEGAWPKRRKDGPARAGQGPGPLRA